MDGNAFDNIGGDHFLCFYTRFGKDVGPGDELLVLLTNFCKQQDGNQNEMRSCKVYVKTLKPKKDKR